MNYMKEIAKMLGVELGEEFEVNGYINTIFRISERGLESYRSDWWTSDVSACVILQSLLTGHDTIKRKPWCPSEGGLYWHIDVFGNPVLTRWAGHSCDFVLYKVGNCYKTEADAKTNRDKWISFYSSDEVLEV
jgi:hypothetical protein